MRSQVAGAATPANGPAGLPAPFRPGDPVSIPLHVADAFMVLSARKFPDWPLLECGSRREVDVALLGCEMAPVLVDWFDRVKTFWRDGGPRTGTPAVMTRRVVAEYRERASSADRANLGFLLEPLAALPGAAPVLAEATSAVPDWGQVEVGLRALNGVLSRDEAATVAVLQFDVPRSAVVDSLLGGLPLLGEQSRTVFATVNHASWRTRRARRLTAVRVEAQDVWPCLPEPAGPC